MMTRKTKPRELIRVAVESSGRPLSPIEIFNSVREKHSSLSLATVYRAIKSLSEEGVVKPVNLPGEPDRYESKRCADHHHHHFHCESCDRVFDIHGCSGQLGFDVPGGFTLKSHQIVLYGDCKDCGKKSGRRFATIQS